MIESPRHDLDAAINRVAERLVAAPEDAGLLSRTVGRLPERRRTPWLLALPVQVAAGVAMLLVAFLFSRPSHEAEPLDVPVQLVAAPVSDREPQPPAPSFAKASEGRPQSRPRDGFGEAAVLDRPDHEFSLPPVAALESIEINAITFPVFAPVAMEALAPLVLTDLALASDSASHHER